MNLNRHPQRATLACIAFAALLGATAVSVQAQDTTSAALPRVDVLAPRVAVRTVCADVDAELIKSLSRAAMRQRESGLVNVSFEIDGRRIDEVAIAGSSFDYRRATRRAVGSLECDNGSAGRQSVQMQVVFKDL